MSYYKKRLIRKYFINLKYARRFREYLEQIKIDDFENKCFYDENWNYLI